MKSALTRRSSRIYGPRSPQIERKAAKSVKFDKTDEIIRYEIQSPTPSEGTSEFNDANRPLPILPPSSDEGEFDRRLETLRNINPKFNAELEEPINDSEDRFNEEPMSPSSEPENNMLEASNDNETEQEENKDGSKNEDAAPLLLSPVEPPFSPIIDRPPMDIRIDAIMDGGSGMSPQTSHYKSHSRDLSNSSVQSEPEYALFKPAPVPLSHNRQMSVESVEDAEWRTQSPSLARQDSLQEDQKQLPTKTDTPVGPPQRDMSFEDLASYNDRRKAILKLLDPKKPNLPSTIMEEPEDLEETEDVVTGPKEGPEDAPTTSKFKKSVNTSVNMPRDQSMVSMKVDFGEDAEWLGDVLQDPEAEFNNTISEVKQENDEANETIGISNEPAALYAAGLSPEFQSGWDINANNTSILNTSNDQAKSETIDSVLQHQQTDSDLDFEFEDHANHPEIEPEEQEQEPMEQEPKEPMESEHEDLKNLTTSDDNLNSESVPIRVSTPPPDESYTANGSALANVSTNVLNAIDQSSFNTNDTTVNHSIDNDSLFVLRNEPDLDTFGPAPAIPPKSPERSRLSYYEDDNSKLEVRGLRQSLLIDSPDPEIEIYDVEKLHYGDGKDVEERHSKQDISSILPANEDWDNNSISEYNIPRDASTLGNLDINEIEHTGSVYEESDEEKSMKFEDSWQNSGSDSESAASETHKEPHKEHALRLPQQEQHTNNEWVETSSLSSLELSDLNQNFSSQSSDSLKSPIKPSESKFSMLQIGEGDQDLPFEAIDFIQRNSPLLSNEEFEQQLKFKPSVSDLQSFTKDMPPNFLELDSDLSDVDDQEQNQGNQGNQGNLNGDNITTMVESSSHELEEPSFGENVAESMQSLMSSGFEDRGYTLRDNNQLVVVESTKHHKTPSEGYEVILDGDKRYQQPPSIPRNRSQLSHNSIPSNISRTNSSLYSQQLEYKPNFETIKEEAESSFDRSTVIPSYVNSSKSVNQHSNEMSTSSSLYSQARSSKRPNFEYVYGDETNQVKPPLTNPKMSSLAEAPADIENGTLGTSLGSNKELFSGALSRDQQKNVKPVEQPTVEAQHINQQPVELQPVQPQPVERQRTHEIEPETHLTDNKPAISAPVSAPVQTTYGLGIHRTQESVVLEDQLHESLANGIGTPIELAPIANKPGLDSPTKPIHQTTNPTGNTPGMLYLSLKSIELLQRPLPSNTLVTICIDNGRHSIESKPFTLAKLPHLNAEYRIQVFDQEELFIKLKVSHTKSKFKRTLKLTSTPDGSYSKLLTPLTFHQEQQLVIEGKDVWNTNAVNSKTTLQTLYLPCVYKNMPQTLSTAKAEIARCQQALKFSKDEKHEFKCVQIGGDVTHKTRLFKFDAQAPLLIALNLEHKPRALINLRKMQTRKFVNGLLVLEFRNGTSLTFKQTDEVLQEFCSCVDKCSKLPPRANWISCYMYET